MAPAPTAYILAGPNGAGKTSLYQVEASAVPRLNGDALYQQGFTVLEVEAALREQLQAWLAASIFFVIETNAASERDYALFRALQKAGYRLELRYVGLESVAVCQQRIAQRVREGGHDVPPALVQQRYTNGLTLLKQYYRLFDRLQLYDNSGTEARQVADLLPGGPPAASGPSTHVGAPRTPAPRPHGGAASKSSQSLLTPGPLSAARAATRDYGCPPAPLSCPCAPATAGGSGCWPRRPHPARPRCYGGGRPRGY